MITASSNLRFSVVFINCGRHGTENVFEARSRDPTKNRFQVSANALEPEQAKVRKCNVCRDWRVYDLRLHITIGNREVKAISRLSNWGVNGIDWSRTLGGKKVNWWCITRQSVTRPAAVGCNRDRIGQAKPPSGRQGGGGGRGDAAREQAISLFIFCSDAILTAVIESERKGR
ncbi:hypothetical protein BGY98DRAFT_931465 [Russula aff. rugulosa BPL654]|nr:hypothetical protein BGY98DRAFT_931465 [Russula aff. rugulosa BPL654]